MKWENIFLIICAAFILSVLFYAIFKIGSSNISQDSIDYTKAFEDTHPHWEGKNVISEHSKEQCLKVIEKGYIILREDYKKFGIPDWKFLKDKENPTYKYEKDGFALYCSDGYAYRYKDGKCSSVCTNTSPNF